MSEEPQEGLVVHKSSRNVRVRTPEKTWLCFLRGKFRAQGSGGLPVVVGDRVAFRPTAEAEGVLEEVLPRKSELRRARSASGRRRRGGRQEQQVIAANMDQVLCVLAARAPEPRWGLADRVLIASRLDEIDAGICVNKWDQVEDDMEAASELEETMDIYRRLGYPVHRASALHGRGCEELERWLRDKVTVLSGHSGVGKSTLLNALSPGEDVPTREVSESTGKGRHMTTAATLYELPEGGFLVDTPGYREYGLFDLDAPTLALYYVEFEPHVSACRYKDCLHVREPECAVLAAKARGEISEFRYQNYQRILASLT